MPQIVNGCGTWYYGKRNYEEYPGTCHSCGQVTTLASYDTRLYVVALMIPIIPLGRRRIIEKCAVCSRHMALSLKEWQVAQERAQTTIQRYRTARGEVQLAEDCLHACVSYRDQQTFVDLAEDMARDFSANARMLLLLAAGYEVFGRPADSERLLRASLALDNIDETRETLADCLLRQGRPAEAEPLLEHIITQGIPDRVDHLYFLAQSWQMKGEHERALAVLNQCETLMPQITEDQTFVALREASRQRLGTHTAVKPEKIVRKVKRAGAWKKFVRIAPVVVALAAIVYIAVALFQAQRPAVYLVSGMDREYHVRLDGTSYTLPPNSIIKATLAEGDAMLQVLDSIDPLPAETLSLHSDVLTRPFSRTVFVVNPDQAALLHRSKVYYGNGQVPDQEDALFAGQTLYQFDGIDAPFEELPESVISSFSIGTPSRDGLYLLSREQDMSLNTRALLLLQTVGQDHLVQIIKRQLAFNPNDENLLALLNAMAAPEDAAQFLNNHLHERPLRVHWHRAYQEAMSVLKRDEETAKLYADMLETAPDDPEFLYLAARASLDRRNAIELCHRAIDLGGAVGRPHMWLLTYYMATGQFELAIQHGAEALRLQPDNASTRAYYSRALLAGAQYVAALEVILPTTRQPYPDCIDPYRNLIYAHSQLGHAEEAREATKQFRTALDVLAPEDVTKWIRSVQADTLYSRGEIDTFLQREDQSDLQDLNFAVAVTRGDPAAAERTLAEDTVSADQHLILYLAAWLKGESDTADRHLAEAIELLAHGDWDSRAFAEALAGKDDFCSAAVNDAFAPYGDKAVYLAAIATLNNECRESCAAMAKRLNFDRRFPHRLVDQVLGALQEPHDHGGPG